jgi:hypothetical protein
VTGVSEPASVPQVRINRDRLWAALMELKEIGAFDGALGVLGGFNGTDHERRPVPHAYLECHIEHGPILAAAGPTAMIFVAGEYRGISPTPREYSSPAACGSGTDVLANAVRRLASQR